MTTDLVAELQRNLKKGTSQHRIGHHEAAALQRLADDIRAMPSHKITSENIRQPVDNRSKIRIMAAESEVTI